MKVIIVALALMLASCATVIIPSATIGSRGDGAIDEPCEASCD